MKRSQLSCLGSAVIESGGPLMTGPRSFGRRYDDRHAKLVLLRLLLPYRLGGEKLGLILNYLPLSKSLSLRNIP